MVGKRKSKVAVEKLQDRRTCTFTIDMTEHNFQRLAALIMLQDHFEIEEKVSTAPLPWEEPRPEKPAELEIDYEAVRRAIIKQAERINNVNVVRPILEMYGASLAEIPRDQLLNLLADLEAQ